MWSHYLNGQPCATTGPHPLLSKCFHPRCMASRKQPELHVSDVPLVRNATIRNRATRPSNQGGCNANHCRLGPLCNNFNLPVPAASFNSGDHVYCLPRFACNARVRGRYDADCTASVDYLQWCSASTTSVHHRTEVCPVFEVSKVMSGVCHCSPSLPLCWEY
jgi:hypothetical protein